MFENEEYFNVNNLQDLGKFNFWEQNKQQSCVHPVLKINKLDKLSFLFEPGYLTNNNEFYKCPLSIGFVQLDYLKWYTKIHTNYLESSLILFSKDYQKKRIIDIAIQSHYVGLWSDVVTPNGINTMINTINIYIDYGNDIDDLEITIFQQKEKYFEKISDLKILFEINKLKYTFFENDSTSVGKDSQYWNEIEISNLPSNVYISDVIIDVISRFVLLDSIKFENYKLLIIYNSGSAYCRTYGRKQISNDVQKEKEISDVLKLNILSVFDRQKELNERIKTVAKK